MENLWHVFCIRFEQIVLKKDFLKMNRVAREIAPFFTALDLRVKRQEILASNIANADTPYYKARDIDFQKAFQHAMRGQTSVEEGGNLPLNTTNQRHLNVFTPDLSLQFHQEYQSAVDNNTVEMDVERTKFLENSLQYQILTQFIAQEFQGMKEALAPVQ